MGKQQPSVSFPTEWLRGMTSLAVLAVLASGPSYGYAISTALAQAGLGQIKGGTLYPILTRLEADGFLASTWEHGPSGPGRKIFSLTELGESHLRDLQSQWRIFATNLDQLITQGGDSEQAKEA
ncbi:hypothetical protein BK816_08070 [Boudabousia tangfeifanii]|uniref:Transcription regulator PadR N-terminal domain-containing protein n=1 Tax=Boudabousia tangfeifanii TaxID=1912795 RepID=A0A1D9MLR7_9ACTO|nr:PadR family transcriptional regulator [Boudabousia tangfeifanii]AOZ73244.1 hypothetical protein BK816_08070 [Boudabousia tangfeifanii]